MKNSLAENNIVNYWLDDIYMNDLISNKIEIIFNNNIFCINCNKKINKTFGEGFCYNCFIVIPESSPCIINPELCEAHLGKGRNIEWEIMNHNISHIVYLSNTSDIKVGVTSIKNIPSRWIDQGAHEAIILAITPNRRIAGEIEVLLKSNYKDKTNWRNMLQNNITNNNDLIDIKWEIEDLLPFEYQGYITNDEDITSLKYNVIKYPSKVKSLKLDKNNKVISTLNGIKGQYLFFDNDEVLNIRAHSGYEIEFIY